MTRALFITLCILRWKSNKINKQQLWYRTHFPKKWQNTNYNGWERDDADLYLDKLGNKTIFEKRLNIQAGNQYFALKKNKYAESEIATVQSLSKYPKSDWVKEDIEKREKDVINKLITFFWKWTDKKITLKVIKKRFS